VQYAAITAPLQVVTSIDGALGPISVESPVGAALQVTPIPGACPRTGASYTAHAGAAQVVYNAAGTGPQTLHLPEKVGAVDLFVDFAGGGLLDFTVVVYEDDGTESVTSFTAQANASGCSGYVAIWHRKRGQIKQITISMSAPVAIAPLIRLAPKAMKKLL
jgi:hypothetical protein